MPSHYGHARGKGEGATKKEKELKKKLTKLRVSFPTKPKKKK